MVMGRHRGLPDSIDPAVKIPVLQGKWMDEFVGGSSSGGGGGGGGGGSSGMQEVRTSTPTTTTAVETTMAPEEGKGDIQKPGLPSDCRVKYGYVWW